MKRSKHCPRLLIFTDLLSASSSFQLPFVPAALFIRGVEHGRLVESNRTPKSLLRTPTYLFSSDSSSSVSIQIDHSRNVIDRQSDAKYDRGLAHISADLREGDVIAYQSGTWYVDGTEVGDGSNPKVRYMQVDTIQLVWTHNCEHGWIHGFDLKVINKNSLKESASGARVEEGSVFITSNEYPQIGPEQVLARIPALPRISKGSEKDLLLSQANFDPEAEIMTSWDDYGEK